jgi:large subunit ribosomal protein L18
MIGKRHKRLTRHARLRRKINGTNNIPRLTVFRSAKYIYAQIISDENAKTLASSSDLKMKKNNIQNGENKTTLKMQAAFSVGQDIASKALAKKIKKVVFDRGGYKFHGRIKALADGARKEGMVF